MIRILYSESIIYYLAPFGKRGSPYPKPGIPDGIGSGAGSIGGRGSLTPTPASGKGVRAYHLPIVYVLAMQAVTSPVIVVMRSVVAARRITISSFSRGSAFINA